MDSTRQLSVKKGEVPDTKLEIDLVVASSFIHAWNGKFPPHFQTSKYVPAHQISWEHTDRQEAQPLEPLKETPVSGLTLSDKVDAKA